MTCSEAEAHCWAVAVEVRAEFYRGAPLAARPCLHRRWSPWTLELLEKDAWVARSWLHWLMAMRTNTHGEEQRWRWSFAHMTLLSLVSRALLVNSEREVWCSWETQISAPLLSAERLCENKFASLNLSFFIYCGRLNMRHPKDVHVLISGTCDYVTLQSKRDFADVIIKIMILRWENHPGLSGWAQCHHKVFKRGTQGWQ